MKSHELLIHYAANNTVHEDARWKEIAEGVINFKPLRKVSISKAVVDNGGLEPPIASSHASTSDGQIRLNAFSRPPTTLNLLASTTEMRQDIRQLHRLRNKRGSQAAFGRAASNDINRGKRLSRNRPSSNYEGSLAKYMKTAKVGPTWETPKSQSLPVADILVPVSKNPKIPRMLCRPGMIGKVSKYNVSQENSTFSCVDETSFIVDSPDASEFFSTQQISRLRRNSDSDQNEIQIYPDHQQQFGIDKNCSQRLDRDSAREVSSLQSQDIDVGTQIGRPSTFATGSAPRPSSQDERSIHTPSLATETPSDRAHCPEDSSPLANRSLDQQRPVVDLTSPTDHSPQQPTRRDILGEMSSPVESNEAVDTTPFTKIASLSRSVMCHPSHTAKSRPFESFVVKRLSDLADKFELIKVFRPVQAPIVLRNAQRGYWRLRINVTDTTTVARFRRPPLTSSQWSDQRFMMRQGGQISVLEPQMEENDILRAIMFPDLDPNLYIPWTLQEFTDFWTCLAKVIERGHAGYDVRATFKQIKWREENLYLDAQIYGYAETLSHLWLLLYAVSNKLTASMPLQWHIPGEGPAITMSGQPRYGGKTGRWVPKGDGADGAWGLEEEDE